MKLYIKIILVAFCMLLSVGVSAQGLKGTVYANRENAPQYPGGMDAMVSDILSRVKYPKKALEKGVSGVVFILADVSKTGKVGCCTIRQSPDPLLEKEAQRVAKSLVFIPAVDKDGKPCKSKVTIPVEFKLPTATTDVTEDSVQE